MSIRMEFFSSDEMIQELAELGFVYVGRGRGRAPANEAGPQTVTLSPAQTDEQQAAAIDKTFDAPPSSKVGEAPPTQPATTQTAPPAAETAATISRDDLRDACVKAANRVGTPSVNALLRETFKVANLNELADDKIAEAHRAVTGLQAAA